MSKRRLRMKTEMVCADVDGDSLSMAKAAKGFVKLLNPQLAVAVEKTHRLGETIAKESSEQTTTIIVDPAEIRKQELQAQMAALQKELELLEQSK